MIENQKGLCLICTEKPEKLFIDNCHETGKVRGLLCSSCNTGIGMLKDDPDVLRAAISYLVGE